MCADHERFEVRVTPRYLKELTRSRGVLLRTRLGRELVKVCDLRVTIMYLLLLILMLRRREESQEDIRVISDKTESIEEEK